MSQITVKIDNITGNRIPICRDLHSIFTIWSKLLKLRISPLTPDCTQEHEGSDSFSSFANLNLVNKFIFLGKQRLC